ncbi:MAG: ankyrin repeat domain-containing protein [Planctomycetota bacterium]
MSRSNEQKTFTCVVALNVPQAIEVQRVRASIGEALQASWAEAGRDLGLEDQTALRLVDDGAKCPIRADELRVEIDAARRAEAYRVRLSFRDQDLKRHTYKARVPVARPRLTDDTDNANAQDSPSVLIATRDLRDKAAQWAAAIIEEYVDRTDRMAVENVRWTKFNARWSRNGVISAALLGIAGMLLTLAPVFRSYIAGPERAVLSGSKIFFGSNDEFDFDSGTAVPAHGDTVEVRSLASSRIYRYVIGLNPLTGERRLIYPQFAHTKPTGLSKLDNVEFTPHEDLESYAVVVAMSWSPLDSYETWDRDFAWPTLLDPGQSVWTTDGTDPRKIGDLQGDPQEGFEESLAALANTLLEDAAIDAVQVTAFPVQDSRQFQENAVAAVAAWTQAEASLPDPLSDLLDEAVTKLREHAAAAHRAYEANRFREASESYHAALKKLDKLAATHEQHAATAATQAAEMQTQLDAFDVGRFADDAEVIELLASAQATLHEADREYDAGRFSRVAHNHTYFGRTMTLVGKRVAALNADERARLSERLAASRAEIEPLITEIGVAPTQVSADGNASSDFVLRWSGLEATIDRASDQILARRPEQTSPTTDLTLEELKDLLKAEQSYLADLQRQAELVRSVQALAAADQRVDAQWAAYQDIPEDWGIDADTANKAIHKIEAVRSEFNQPSVPSLDAVHHWTKQLDTLGIIVDSITSEAVKAQLTSIREQIAEKALSIRDRYAAAFDRGIATPVALASANKLLNQEIAPSREAIADHELVLKELERASDALAMREDKARSAGALASAVRSGDLHRVNEVLAFAPGPNAHDNATGATPLHLAAKQGDDPIVRRLLDAKAAVDAKDHDGWTPLAMAAVAGHDQVVATLLRRGAAADVRIEGNAIMFHREVLKRPEVLRLIIRHCQPLHRYRDGQERTLLMRVVDPNNSLGDAAKTELAQLCVAAQDHTDHRVGEVTARSLATKYKHQYPSLYNYARQGFPDVSRTP